MPVSRWVAAGSMLCALTLHESAWAAGSCGDGGIVGDQEQVEFQGSVYYVTTPESYDPQVPWPLILGLHGDEGDPASSVNWFWRDVPDGTFIFVAPKAPNPSGSWYEETESNSEWMDALLASLQTQYNIDLDRTYIWGLSGGAVFSSRYVMTRQDVFAAVQFNMGGSGRNYVEPPSETCKIPARFVVSPDDFLREGAMGFFELLTEHGHETEWVDADCDGHCWGDEQSEDIARDWLLSFSLCGNTPTTHCDGEPPPPPDDPDPPGAGGASSGGTTGAGGTNAGGTNAGGTNAGGTSTGGASAGGTSSGGTSSGGTSSGGTSSGGDDADANRPGADSGPGIACRFSPVSATGGSSYLGAAWALLFGLTIAWRVSFDARRRARRASRSAA